MAIQSIPAAAAGKTAFRTTLTSGTSYTVPAGVTYLNVTLQGGGGGGGGNSLSNSLAQNGFPGQMITSTFATSPGASISYAIGAGGTAGVAGGSGGTGGTTTMTGATSATGGLGGREPGGSGGTTGRAGTNAGFSNYGGGSSSTDAGGAGGAGRIDIEYWV